MTITNRVSVFFQITLALILIGFSLLLYFLKQNHEFSHASERLSAAINTLAAAVEDEPEGLEWDRAAHDLHFFADGEQIHWAIWDENDALVDSSDLPSAEQMRKDRNRLTWNGQDLTELERADRILTGRHLQSKNISATTPIADARRHHYSLMIYAGLSKNAIHESLRNLASLLSGISLSVWLATFFVNRWICRRALRPLSRMAAVAREISTEDLADRLPHPQTRDELEELGTSFNDLLSRVHDAYERQKQFAGEASHQLRTPLTVLKGSIDVALRRERPVEEYQRVLRLLGQKVENLQSITEMLLFLARSDSEKQAIMMSEIDLAVWLPVFLEETREHYSQRKLELSFRDEKSVVVSAHAGLLGQLLGNLIDNANKHSPLEFPIRLEVAASDSAATIAVIDRGPGIAAHDLSRIFEPFYRSEESRNAGLPGVGLGLAVAQRLAKTMGAQLSVTSTPGQGSRFQILFPLLIVQEEGTCDPVISQEV
ncbi:HAMP domain-containing protein [Telmatocola sphagniphila]|uniref:histidine kinase n=1 Tax=Telmatocola sphagniphila TaxID=1123043 RepID=A0A8E6B4U4_9BACT|nr:ATP-binding protein [Telmatocola sphagniphila]QVL31454.1 HAMP domain-containing protein [Telmatocola sphagniphila]